MEILLFRHYPLVEGPSMRSFALQIATGLRDRGHHVRETTAPLLLGRLARRQRLCAKWLGYIDQYVLFRLQLWWLARRLPPRTLCVFCDQALGPWIPALKHHPHVVHVHDLLALQAAQGRRFTIWAGVAGFISDGSVTASGRPNVFFRCRLPRARLSRRNCICRLA